MGNRGLSSPEAGQVGAVAWGALAGPQGGSLCWTGWARGKERGRKEVGEPGRGWLFKGHVSHIKKIGL